jgi:hypothetical protein
MKIELDLRPPDGHYSDDTTQAICRQIAEDIARLLNAGRIDVQFTLLEHGIPRMGDNTTIQ